MHGANRLTAERKGILRAGRNESAQECRGEIIQLIRQGNGAPSLRFRQNISGKTRHILLENRLRDRRFLPIQKGVFFPHFALEFREFRHHARREIRFGEIGRAESVFRFFVREMQSIRQERRKFPDAVRFVDHRAHAFLVIDARGIFAMSFQRFLSVVVKEKFRIIEPRPEHAFISDLHIFNRVRAAVPHRQEIRKQTPVFLLHGVIPLMIAHRRDDSRDGKLQKFRVNSPVERRRIFHDVINFFQKFGIVPHNAGKLRCLFQKTLANHLAPLVLIDDDIRRPHGLDIRRRRFDFDIALR